MKTTLMGKLFTLGFMALGVMGASFTQVTTTQAETLRVASEGAYPPFNYFDANNNLIGFDIDIAHAICDKMKVKCQIIGQDWDGMIPGLLADKFDVVIASMSPTPERLEVVDFTNRYYTSTLVIAVPKDSPIKDVSTASLKGKSLGAQAGTIMSMYAEDVYAAEGAIARSYPTAEQANSDLKNNRLDAVISDIFPLIDWLDKEGKDCCKLLGKIEGTDDAISIAIRKNREDLKQRINKAIDDLRADGTYDKISKKYFPIDIY